MLDDDEFRIQLRVADNVYPAFCKRSEERLLRKAATLINEKIQLYSEKFLAAKLDKRNLLALAAIHISAENELLRQEADTSPLLEKIELLDKELEEYIHSI